jgi:hypothetical protein
MSLRLVPGRGNRHAQRPGVSCHAAILHKPSRQCAGMMDAANRFLNREEFSPRALFEEVRP